jgi:hypothetical protein
MSEPEPCVGYMVDGIYDNALDLVRIWHNKPYCRDEFGRKELELIEEAQKKLAGLQQYIIIHMNRKKLKGITNAVSA